jgi:hypothetical protein
MEHIKDVSSIVDPKVHYCISTYLKEVQKLTQVKDKSEVPIVYPVDMSHTFRGLSDSQIETIKSFWNSPIDFDDPRLSRNLSPFIIMEKTPLSKVHFLFTMLNATILLVVDKGLLKGMLTKLDFIKKRRTVQSSEDSERKLMSKFPIAYISVKDSNQRTLIDNVPLCRVQRHHDKEYGELVTLLV